MRGRPLLVLCALAMTSGCSLWSRRMAVARPCPPEHACEYTPTMVTWFGHALSSAQALFGERDPRFTLLGIELSPLRGARLWFPEFATREGRSGQYVVVQVQRSAAWRRRVALRLLAEQSVMLLSPGERTSYLEQGLATWYATWYLQQYGIHQDPIDVLEADRYFAYSLVETLFASHHDAGPNRIRVLRLMEPDLTRVRPEQLLHVFPDVNHDVAVALCEPWPAGE